MTKATTAPPAPLDPGTFLRERVAPQAKRRIDELRAQMGRLEREIADRVAAEATVELALEGSGGGRWYLNLRQGEIHVEDRPAGPPVVRIEQRRDDWEALAREQVGTTTGASSAADLTRTRIERLRKLSGAIAFRLSGDEREHAIVVRFGGDSGDPRCTISLRAADAARLQAGELSPQVAFMQGLVKLEGDMAFAMQVGATLFA